MRPRHSALDDLIATLRAGAICTQEAGDGPFVYVSGSERRYSASTARRGERLGLMSHQWCPVERRWRWTLTQAGLQPLSERVGKAR